MQLPEMLVKIMAEKHITAYRIEKDIGMPNRLIGYYRTGERDPSSKNLLKLAEYFDVSVDYLLGRTEKPEVNR